MASTQHRRSKAFAERISEDSKLEAIGFIIQEVLFDVKPQPILLKRLRLSGLIAYHKPIFLTVLGSTQRKMHRAITILCNVDMMPEERLACSQRNAIHFTVTLPATMIQKLPLIRMRQCQPNLARCSIRCVSANPRSAVKTTRHRKGNKSATFSNTS